jgi:hypothetical protein
VLHSQEVKWRATWAVYANPAGGEEVMRDTESGEFHAYLIVSQSDRDTETTKVPDHTT